MEYKTSEPKLKGSTAKDASAYKSDTGGAAGMKKGASKLDVQGGVKGKDGACYKDIENAKKQAGAE